MELDGMPDNPSERSMPGNAWEGTQPEPNPSFNKNMEESSFLVQFQALMLRNLAIKKRDRRKSLTELLMPLYWIAILAIIRVNIHETVLDPVETPHGEASLMQSLVFLTNQTIHVAPDNVEVEDVMEGVQSIAARLNTLLYVNYYTNEAELLEQFLTNKSSVRVGIIFQDDPQTNRSYKLRFNPLYSKLPLNWLWDGGKDCRQLVNPHGLQSYGCTPNIYFFSGFSALQTVIDVALTNLTTTTRNVQVPDVILENFPRGRFESSGGLTLRNIVPLYMVFAWAQFILYMMMLVVEEKEKKLKESMKMMGLRDSVYWLSWFCVYAIYVLLLALICIIVLPLAQVFQKANLILLFLLFVLYGFSSIMFGFMLTPFFNKAKVAGVVGNLVQILLSLLFYLQVYLEDEVDPALFWGLGLLSPCAFAFAIDKVTKGLAETGLGKAILFDYSSDGLTFASVWEGPGLPFAGSLIMITIDIFLYLFLAYYLDNLSNAEDCDNSAYVSDPGSSADVEPVSAEMKERTAVRIRNLEKIFYSRGKAPVKAVNGFSLDIYEGQITAILGHNGAGKTTLFNILTGMTAPSRGSATIFGLDISNIDNEVEQTLKEVDLDEKGDTKAADLSGGQKRKLSIAIALIGDPKMIFLDEPTAGVDTYSRRKLWTLLRNRKAGKVILLTTHFMDEADILADRKAIMTKGRLRCCGTSLFLKNKFGLGYHLTCNRYGTYTEHYPLTCSLIVEENSDEEKVGKSLQKVIPEVQLARYYGKEMAFVLPSNSSPRFPSLFKQLDESIASTQEGIEGYGVSMTTLEEVFLVLNDESEEGELGSMDDVGQQMVRQKCPSASPTHSASAQENTATDNYLTSNKGFVIETVDVQKSSWRAFVSLLKMRCIGLLREPAAVVFLILFPLAFTIASIALANSQNIKISTDETVLLNPSRERSRHYLRSAVSVAARGRTESEERMSLARLKHQAPDRVRRRAAFSLFLILDDKVEVRVRFNDSYMHSIPILVNLLNNAVLRSVKDAAPISVSSQSLPITSNSVTFDAASFIAPMMIGFAFTIIPAGLTMDLVNDREMRARYLLRLNGVGFHLYFCSYLIMMIAIYMVSYLGLLIIIAAFGVKSLVIPAAFVTLALLYLLYIPAAILFSAVMSYLFDKSETARQFYPNMVTTLGFVTYTAVALVDTMSQRKAVVSHHLEEDGVAAAAGEDEDVRQERKNVAAALLDTAAPSPALIYVGDAAGLDREKKYIDLGKLYKKNTGNSNPCKGKKEEELFPALKSVSFEVKPSQVFGLLGPNGAGKTTTLSIMTAEETASKGRVQICGQDIDSSLSSVFEALGYCPQHDALWANITVAEHIAGYAEIRGIRRNQIQPHCSYHLNHTTTPQTPPAITPTRYPDRRHEASTLLACLRATASLCALTTTRGPGTLLIATTAASLPSPHTHTYTLPRPFPVRLVDTYVKGLEIEEHRDKKTKECSGGTKRKLSYILSMLGRPRVVLLDEPSTGMDPKSKRFLWNSILSSFRDERSAILTTHSMEEADALCSSIGILVRGTMRCIGPIQHLKNKYGRGYTLEVKVRRHRAPVSMSNASSPGPGAPVPTQQANSVIGQVQAKVKDTFPNATLDEQFDERLIYKVPQTDVSSLGLIFEMLERIKSDGLVDEYALSQTTLEQIFLQFARQQEESQDEVINNSDL
ncbi:ATP-binding cassette sub-family A member 5 [Chionoecetes opilio]|uniref:ATP-binding cassette sub-family A member 5 n=1 Tax=Chionoecetes opilio TaxID=41210 RepID=A0A8J4YLJ4_CHIOP|nr:ATP-binding cassette sub-family A member 5 [Chionoecetes opilio]